ncbi:MAG: homoserine kinase [Aureispira sp.]|nr:homoserine kinase [Aureispira sp.]
MKNKVSKKLCAFAPATIANLSCGFDILGLALNSVGDRVEVSFAEGTAITISEIVNGDNLPKAAEKNCCSVVMQKMRERLGDTRGINIRIYKGFQSGSGLGSSSASSAAAAFVYNELLDRPFTKEELVPFAMEGERVACGAAHADNVAPAILGGIVLVREHNPIDMVQLPVLDSLYGVLMFPNIKIKTADARQMLPEKIKLTTATKQWANVGGFVAALYTNNYDLLSKSMQDLVAEPTRSQLIPKYQDLKKVAETNGALAFGISGSGPSVFALAKSEELAKDIQKAMLDCYADTGIETMSFIDKIESKGGARLSASF